MSTPHSGQVYVKNNWGITIAELYIRHRRSNDPNEQEDESFYSIPQGETVGPMAITYKTGVGSPFDYWWVKFVTIAGETWQCKDNFYCSISSSDNGKVNIELHGDNTEMTVDFSDSSGCYVNLYKPS